MVLLLCIRGRLVFASSISLPFTTSTKSESANLELLSLSPVRALTVRQMFRRTKQTVIENHALSMASVVSTLSDEEVATLIQRHLHSNLDDMKEA